MARWHRFRDWRSGVHHVQEMAQDIIKVVQAVDIVEERGMLEPIGREAILTRLDAKAEELQKKLENIRTYRDVTTQIEGQS